MTLDPRQVVARIIAAEDIKTWGWSDDFSGMNFQSALIEQTAFHLPTADLILSALEGVSPTPDDTREGGSGLSPRADQNHNENNTPTPPQEAGDRR